MTELEDADRTVRAALATGQIGVPLAVRLVWHGAEEAGGVARRAEAARAVAGAWLDDRQVRLHSVGGEATGQITSLAGYARGGTALVSVGGSGETAPRLGITVWGNRGMLAWNGGEAEGVGSLFASTGDQPAFSSTRKDSRPPGPWGVLLVSGEETHQPMYAAALAADPRCRLVGVTDERDLPARRQEKNAALAARLGIPWLYDLQAALARPDVHIVSICAEPQRRGPIIVAAARAGKHLYLDKPLAGTAAEADAICAAVRDSGVVAHMFSQVHVTPAQRARRVVQSGKLGELLAIHCDLCFAKGYTGGARLGPRRESPAPAVYELPDCKRELTNIGVYPLMLIEWLLDRRVTRVAATTGNYFFEEHQRHDMEDFGQMLLELEGGVAASVSAGRTGWRSHPAGGLNRVVLVGTRGTAAIDVHRPRVEVWADVEPWTAPPRNPDDPMAMWPVVALPEGGRESFRVGDVGDRLTEDAKRLPTPFVPRPKQSWIAAIDDFTAADAKHFLDCVEQGQPSEIPADLAARTTHTLLAAYRSAATGEEVQLQLHTNPKR